jgi:serine/threonine protein phosphatase 1
MIRTFVLGDIHGAHKALLQCFERSGFDPDADHLIFLGDVADGWPDTKQCIDELLQVKRLTYIFGNHDFWTLEWMQTGYKEEIWLAQGGRATVASYPDGIPAMHKKLLDHALPYYIEDNRLYVHAGIDPLLALENQSLNIFLWDRTLAHMALDYYAKGTNGKITQYHEVFLGHTPISSATPVKGGEVWLMDTGAGWNGVLSMMDVNTKEVYTSDPVPSLYPGVEGRKKFRSL